MNQYTSKAFNREANAIRTIEERTPEFEYAGGFTHCDGSVLLRCKKCGHVQSRSMISVRKQAVGCENCREQEARAKQEERESIERRKKERKERAEANRVMKETEMFLKTRLVECEECGEIFTTRNERQVCCSGECSKKRLNRIATRRKDARVALDKRIDKNITTKKLYARDGGVCWICGKMCDMNDYKEQDGVVICGNNYPSVDHVVPICDGGEDSWQNVRLAHRICNSIRYNIEKFYSLPKNF